MDCSLVGSGAKMICIPIMPLDARKQFGSAFTYTETANGTVRRFGSAERVLCSARLLACQEPGTTGGSYVVGCIYLGIYFSSGSMTVANYVLIANHQLLEEWFVSVGALLMSWLFAADDYGGAALSSLYVLQRPSGWIRKAHEGSRWILVACRGK